MNEQQRRALSSSREVNYFDLRYPITIFFPMKASDGEGGFLNIYPENRRVFAKVENMTQNPQVEIQQVLPGDRIKITMRAKGRQPFSGCRVTWQGRHYTVEAVAEVGEKYIICYGNRER
jgi:hypothetical protein